MIAYTLAETASHEQLMAYTLEETASHEQVIAYTLEETASHGEVISEFATSQSDQYMVTVNEYQSADQIV